MSEKINKHIKPININGLKGRFLTLPSERKRNILLIYGHHSSLERWSGVSQALNKYGSVTAPDLPGFGGMDSFYKIGLKPSLDNFADYLASFIKLKFKNKKICIVGLSFGFVVATRMLARHPELTKNVELFISVVGFTNGKEFKFSKTRRFFYNAGCSLISNRLISIFFDNVCLHPSILSRAYAKTHNAKDKFSGVSQQKAKETMDFEIHLWHINDSRTWARTTKEFLALDHLNNRIGLPIHHVYVEQDRYFNNELIIQHMNVVFSKCTVYKSNSNNHAPSILATAEESEPLIPQKLRKVLLERAME